ncbi:MAG: urate hydroxylase PuuD [Oligoflexia bacterium]|jgi:uncharacterized membrane protein
MSAGLLSHLQDWLSLSLRWVHLVAGISWIGSSFYFMWLDASLEPPEATDTEAQKRVEGQLWMVHSGGFYQVQKRKIRPGEMPKTLHWFKWEAMFTVLTGLALLVNLYYLTGGVYLLDSNVSSISLGAASALGLGILAVSWFAYDALWNSNFAQSRSGLATTLCYVALVAMVIGLCKTLSGRAAFIHVGAVMGTIMVLNVWVRILPAQQKMIDATAEGKIPDYGHGLAAKRRSVHNSYMTFPVLFVMLSNHYSMTFGHAQNWLILLLLIFAGAAIRHVMIGKSANARWAALPAAAALLGVIGMTAPAGALQSAELGEPIAYSEVHSIIERRCTQCHSSQPTDDVFKVAPNGVMFDAPEKVKAMAEKIQFRVVITKTMPMNNKTGITDDEREVLSKWIRQGAKLQ